MPLYKIILPKQQSSYETHKLISTHVHSWPLKVIETLEGSPAFKILDHFHYHYSKFFFR